MTATTPARPSAIQEIGAAVRHSAVYSMGNIIAKAMGFLMLPLFTHYLTPSDYGLLELIELSITVLGMVLQMGLAPALLRCYAAARTQEEKNQSISTVFIFVGVTGVIVYVCGLAIIRPVSAAILGPSVSPKYFVLSFSSFVLSYMASPVRIYLRALEASGKLTVLDTITTALVGVLNVVMLVVFKLGLFGVMLSPVIVNAAWMILAAIILGRVGFRFNLRQLRSMMQFGTPLILSNMSVFVLNFGDRFFLQRSHSLAVVGLYALGYKFGFMISLLLTQPFMLMWQSRMYAVHDNPERRSIFGQIFVLYSMLLTYSALGLALLGREIIHIAAGPAYAGAASVIPLIAFAYVLSGVGSYLQTGLYIENRTGWIGIVSGVSSVASLALYAVLIPPYGMIGASWATVLSFVVLSVGTYWCSEKLSPLGLPVQRVVLGIALAVAVYVGFLWWTPSHPGIALAAKLMALATFPVMAFTLRVFGPGERAIVRAAAGRLSARFAGMFAEPAIERRHL